MLWKLNLSTETVECIQTRRGHERAINFVAVDKNASFLVTGGWDNMIKIWGASTIPSLYFSIIFFIYSYSI